MPESRLCLFGAAPDSGNLGVSALCHGTLAAIARRAPGTDVTVFDFGRGERAGRIAFEGGEFPFRRRGGTNTRRYWRAEATWQIRVAIWLGALGHVANGGARRIAGADAVLDLSGGDSFSDIYGLRRFRSICLPKLATLEAGVPLVLLPQTYGPYASSRSFATAREIVRGAAMAWARDERSFESLRELLGGDFDPARHRSAVDVAFGLPAIAPERVPERLERWLGERGTRPVAGLNVSGLIHGNPAARAQYGLAADYERLIADLARGLLADGARLVLLPHVFGALEDDAEACRRVLAGLGPGAAEDALVLDGGYDAAGAKWLISRLDYFCGTRMHTCIAGLSSGVPTAGLAYSKKTLGVFETCGQGDAVPDLRRDGAGEVVERALAVWRERAPRRAALAAAVPGVVARSADTMARVLAVARERAERRREERLER